MSSESTEKRQNEYPRANAISLPQKQLVFSARVQSIIDSRNEHGEYNYSNSEVRDFVVACIFELGLPLTRELELIMHRFLDDEIDIATDDPTSKDVVEGVRSYFAAHPLNEQLARAFRQLGTEAFQAAGEGFHQDSNHMAILAATTGTRTTLRTAPRLPQPEGPAVVARRGIPR